MADLKGKVCIVTGGSRGIGRGVALGLVEAGAIVHVSGRTATAKTPVADPEKEGSLEKTLRDAAPFPGTLFTHVCDHRDDGQTEGLIRTVLERHGHIDLLVNNAWGGYEHMIEGGRFTWIDPFWDQPMWRWHAMFDAGVQPAYVASRSAAAGMVRQGSGLIVNISFWAAQHFEGNVAYGVAKAAVDKMAADMAWQLRPHGVAAVALYPGLVRTEAVLRNAEHFDMSNSESPQFIGRVIAGLAKDPALMEKSGKVHVAAALALEYGIADIDGKQPRPLTLATLYPDTAASA